MQGHVACKGNRWYAVVYDGVDPQTGKERRRWHPAGADRAEAERLADELATASARRRAERKTGLTLASFVDGWWLPAKQRQLRPTTLDGYRRNHRLHILPHLGETVLRDLQPEDAEHLYATLLDDGRHDRAGGLAPKTVHEIHLLLRNIGDDAVRRGMLPSNPIRLAAGPKFRRDHRRRRMAWDAHELAAFLTRANGHVHHRSFWLAAHTGMRRGELLGLRWRDVDLHRRRLTIARGIVCVGTRLEESPGKTPNSARSIDLDDATVQLLDQWHEHQQSTQDVEPVELFAKPDGQLLHPQTLSPAFERLVATTTLPRITLHGLRHTHATLLQSRRSAQGRLGAARPLDPGVHDGDLPARPARHASRRRRDLRGPARSRRVTSKRPGPG